MPNSAFNLEDYKNKLIKTSTNINFQSTEAVFVLQHELAITHANAKTPILVTSGADSCFILALFDKKKKIAALAHIDALTNIESLEVAINHMSNKVEAHIYGGRDDSTLATQILQFLNKHHITIVNADILRTPDLPEAALAINAKDGTVYTNFPVEQLTYDADTQQRMLKFAAANEARLKEGEERITKFIAMNKHLFKDQTVMEALIADLQQFPIDAIFVDVPEKKLGNSIWTKISTSLHKSKTDKNIQATQAPDDNIRPGKR